MTNGYHYHKHLLYVDRFVDKIDKAKAEEDARRGSRKKGHIIRISSTVVRRVAE
jgi:hypothetical protein